jgi:rhamnogalacturonan endolyase
MAMSPFATVAAAGLLLAAASAPANIPGGGTGAGPAVTLVNNSNGTVTMGNGIVSVLCATNSANITQINYTYNNGGGTVTNQLLLNGTQGGKFYWETGGFGSGSFSYSVVANDTNYCEIDLPSASATSGVMDVHFSMLRGSPGFYVTVIFSHRAADAALTMGETRDNIYAGAIFNWMSVDAARNRLMEVQPGSGAAGVLGAPVEVSLWTNGLYQGRYEDKYKYSADLGAQRVWGWSSVGAGGANVGLWNVSASVEYYSDGPLKRDLMEHIGTTILNMLESSHYGGAGTDAKWAAGEVWTKVCGPYFIYCNNVTNALTAANQAAQALYSDALAQAAAEATAWPYSWFTNANYAPASQRGAVSGQIVIHDTGNPNASAAGLWVGLIQQPVTSDSVYDFQQWIKTCQFWVNADTNGNFTISNVIAGTNYTLYAFGPGAAGTFQSQALSGGGAPNTVDLPAAPFSVKVTAGATTNLGAIAWTPTRVGATVFEIGYPDRTARKFRHGEDWWVGDIGPAPTNPMPIWSKFLEYPFDFPNGPTYTVGQSRWSTDWNFVQPIVVDSQGNDDPSTSTIAFNLAHAPAGGAQASLYVALASDYQGALIIQVNGNNVAGSSGYFPAYSGSGNENDTTVREGINGAFSDFRTNFAGSLLEAGQNVITINMRKGGYFANHAMFDYLRLELTGYVPPPPAGVAAYAGNNGNLVCWPVTPGATSYNILRSTNSGSGYVPIANGVLGPVCGGGLNNAVWLDTNVINGSTYYYVAQSVNPGGASANSPQSPGATPSAALSTNPPAAPAGLAVTAAGHQSVALSWNASPGAGFYTVYRSTLVDNGGGGSNVLNTIPLNNNVTGTTYTDTSPTDGSIYSYTVAATGAGGTSANSSSVVAVPLPPPPGSAPGSLAGSFASTNVVLNWSPVAGAVGYIVSRASGTNGPYAFLMSITETTYTDIGLNTNGNYYYQVIAVNAGGISTAANVSVLGSPPPPTLTALAGNGQVYLRWSAITSATNYVLQSSAAFSGPYTTIVTTTNTSYINSNLLNGATYYYVVFWQGPGGQGPLSAPAQATPSLSAAGVYWTNIITASAQSWNVNANWIAATAFPNGAGAVAIVNAAIAANQIIDLNQAVSVGALDLGANGGTFTLAAGGGALTFNNAPGTAALTELPAGRGDTISAPMALNSALTISNASANMLTLSGTVSGTNALSKTGAGTVALTGSNTFSGGTTISGGTLQINNVSGSGTGSGAVTVAGGGTLGGNGIIAGAVTVNSGGALAPGNPLGALTIGGNLTLAAGSTTYVQIESAPVTNGGAIISGALSEGGTLNVTNIRGTAAAGNSFKLFGAARYSGSFTNFALPALPANLAWSTARLGVDGSLWVVSIGAPSISQTYLAGTNLAVSGAGGAPYGTYYVLTTTNLALPAGQWAILATNQFDAAGNFSFTNAINPGVAQLFYALEATP